MTSELRPAVGVWDDAIAAWAADTIDTRQAAAAVIEADREAVRAYWYRQGKDDGWQCREDQAAELAKFKALAETLAGALEAGTRFMPSSATVWHREATKALRKWEEARDAS